MTRESVPVKARRYLAEGRLTVRRVAGPHIDALCRGDGTVHRLGHTPARGWHCTCPARTRCSHLLALGLVIDLAAYPNTDRNQP